MHLQVYIDTNVYLSLLAAKATVTPEMSKFLALCENGSLQLYLPRQTEDEYFSNREDVVANTIRDLRKAGAIGAFPPIVDEHTLGEEAKRLRRELAATIQTVETWYSAAAQKHELPFDGWFSQIVTNSHRIENTPDILAKAKQRAAAHLPPGKSEDLGDRLIWECLLEASSFCEDLHLITSDQKDYRSPLDPSEPRRKLREEWDNTNWGSVYLYGSIDEFLTKAGQTDRFTRAAEIGRAIWTLNHTNDEEAISNASSNLQNYIAQFSLRQARLIAKAGRSYYDRVFITSEKFDHFIIEFWRLYEKHFDKQDKEVMSPVISYAGGMPADVRAAANSN